MLLLPMHNSSDIIALLAGLRCFGARNNTTLVKRRQMWTKKTIILLQFFADTPVLLDKAS